MDNLRFYFRFLVSCVGLLVYASCGNNPEKMALAPDATGELNQKIQLGATYVSKSDYPASINFDKNLKVTLGSKTAVDLRLGIDAKWQQGDGTTPGKRIEVKELFLFVPSYTSDAVFQAKATISRPVEWDDDLLAAYSERYLRGHTAGLSAECLGFREGRIVEFSKPSGVAPNRLQTKYKMVSNQYTYYAEIESLSSLRNYQFIGMSGSDDLFQRLVGGVTEKKAQSKILAERFASVSEKLCEGVLNERAWRWEENILYVKEFSADHFVILPRLNYHAKSTLEEKIRELREGYFTQQTESVIDVTEKLSSVMNLKGRSQRGDGLFDLEINVKERRFVLGSRQEDADCKFHLQGGIAQISQSTDMTDRSLRINLAQVLVSLEKLRPERQCQRSYEELKSKVENGSIVFYLSGVSESRMVLSIPEIWNQEFGWEAQ